MANEILQFVTDLVEGAHDSVFRRLTCQTLQNLWSTYVEDSYYSYCIIRRSVDRARQSQLVTRGRRSLSWKQIEVQKVAHSTRLSVVITTFSIRYTQTLHLHCKHIKSYQSWLIDFWILDYPGIFYGQPYHRKRMLEYSTGIFNFKNTNRKLQQQDLFDLIVRFLWPIPTSLLPLWDC